MGCVGTGFAVVSLPVALPTPLMLFPMNRRERLLVVNFLPEACSLSALSAWCLLSVLEKLKTCGFLFWTLAPFLRLTGDSGKVNGQNLPTLYLLYAIRPTPEAWNLPIRKIFFFWLSSWPFSASRPDGWIFPWTLTVSGMEPAPLIS